MRLPKKWLIVAAAFALTAGLSSSAKAAPAELHALLILASNNPAPLDSRLDPVEYKLRRIFGFETYRFLSESTVLLNSPGESVIPLSGGNKLTIQSKGKGGRIEAQIRWENAGGMVLNTTVVMSRNNPVILGGSKQGDGTLIIALTVK